MSNTDGIEGLLGPVTPATEESADQVSVSHAWHNLVKTKGVSAPKKYYGPAFAALNDLKKKIGV